jgi:hypothetical protein
MRDAGLHFHRGGRGASDEPDAAEQADAYADVQRT